jgi:transcriptional regulator with XRE-family HTH domain
MPIVASVNPIDKYVGSRVRQLRKKHGLSQSTLGAQLGITFQQVQKYEKGANRISSSRLQHIGEILGVPVPYFFDGAPSVAGLASEALKAPEAAMIDPTAIARFAAGTKDGLALVKAFQLIDDAKVRRSLVRMVEVLAEQ